MSAPGIDEACVDLAEHVLAPELERAGADVDTDARVLSLAAAIQDAVEAWVAAQADEAAP